MKGRSLSARIERGSALDALADGPQTRALGLTQRLHDVVERYQLLVGSVGEPLAGSDLDALEGIVKIRTLPPPSDPLCRTGLALYATTLRPADDPDRLVLARRIELLTTAELIWLVERLEERLLTRA